MKIYPASNKKKEYININKHRQLKVTRTAAVESVNLRLDLSCRGYRHAITFVND